jgi:subtilisin family serine protease
VKSSFPSVLGSLILGATLGFPVADLAQAASAPRAVTSRTSSLKVDRSLVDARGPVDVVIQLSGLPLAVANGPDAKRLGGRMSRGQQIAHSQQLRRDQDALLARVLAIGGKEIARVRMAYNAAIVRIDAEKVRQIASLPGVSSIQRIPDFRLNLVDTVPWVGADIAQAASVTGKGVRVAVLDSGIDYTHRNLGGAGTPAAYAAAYGTASSPRHTTRDGLFPTSKVVEGYDFVGEHWTGGVDSPLEEPDDDPIDADGHGTHVADIIGGRSNDGRHVGVAPGVSLLAVKVCSAHSTSCSGKAILQGLDFALDPNNDGSMDDAADIINISIAAPYGQREDSTAVAAANAVKAGVVVVTVAGNSGDKPYVLGSPGIAPEVITVAQTQMPRATAIPLVIEQPLAIRGTYLRTAVLDWAPVREDTNVTGQVAFVGTGCADEPYLENPAGKIALLDRGDCDVSVKVRRATEEGAIGTIVAMVDDSEPLSFSNGGECPPPGRACVPSVVILKSLADSIRANLAEGVQAQISYRNGIFLSQSVVNTSARGPSYDYNQIKPDLAAPGASISADVGTGNGEVAFSGTSGSAPMVAGAAALMLEAYPNRAPWAIKSALMNTADSQVFSDPVFLPNVPAPITRIGAGELQVNKALATTTVAWDAARRTGSLSFGHHNVSDSTTLVRTVRVQNYSRSPRRYEISSEFRYSDDAQSGALRIVTPPSVVVPAFGSATFEVAMKIDPARLPPWTFFGGWNSGNGPLLQTVEYDGFLTLKDSRDTVRMPWHVLPHRSADLHAVNKTVVVPTNGFGVLGMVNMGRGQAAGFDVFALTGTSPRLRPWQQPDEDQTTVHDLAAVGVRQNFSETGEPLVQFAISTHGRRAHPSYPGRFDVFIDSDNDGRFDYLVFNGENGGFDATGQTLVAVDNLSIPGLGDAITPFYAEADINSGNLIMTVPAAAIGVTYDRKFRFDVEAHDNYFALQMQDGLSDSIRGSVFTLNKPRFLVDVSNLPQTGIPPRSGGLVKVVPVAGGDRASPSQSGLLIFYPDAKDEAETVTVISKGRR